MKNRIELRGQGLVIFLKFRKGGHIEAIVDACDLAIVDSYQGTWHASWSKTSKSYYVEGNYQYPDGWGKLKLHRMLMGTPQDKEIDHKNHDTLNNRRGNLRTGSKSLNMLNSSKLFPRGVHWDNTVGKWCARLMFDGKVAHLGFFLKFEEAHVICADARADLELAITSGEHVDIGAIKRKYWRDGRYKHGKFIGQKKRNAA